MKRIFPAIALLLLVALPAVTASGCIKVNLPDSGKGPATIGSVAMATSVAADGKPLAISGNFIASTPVIFVSLQVLNAPENTAVGATWTFTKDGSGNAVNQQLFNDSATAEGTQYISFNHTPPSGVWAPGQYTVSITLDGASVTSTSFTIQQVQQAGMPAPTISHFTATPDTISTGQAVTLSWSTTGASEVSLSGAGKVPPAGNKVVTPVNSSEYTLTATNSAGTTSLKVSINVTSYISDKPDLTITDFWVEGTKAFYKIKNIGQNRDIPSAYTNPNARATLTYLYINGSYSDSSRVEVLAPEEERTLSFPNYVWTHGAARSFTLPIRICADSQNAIGEYDENNNCLVLNW